MPTYVADTIALARYLEDSLQGIADQVFRDAEAGSATILLPSIVLGEFFYFCLKGRIATHDPVAIITELLDDIETSAFLVTVDMDVDSWRHFIQLKVPELHDRMICAIALAHSADAIITKDAEITSSGIKTIW